jgi:hypothetical protein
LLALATIKPQLTVLLVAWLMLWTVSDLRRRWRFLASFAMTLAALVVGGELVLPGWIPRFVQGLAAYRQYTGGAESCLDVLVTPAFGHWLTAAVLIGLAVVCWRFRTCTADSPQFFRVNATVLAVTVVVVPMIADYNQMLLLPAILLVVSEWQFQSGTRAVRLIAGIAMLALLWPWLAAIALTLASFFLRPEVVQQAWALPIYTRVAVPLAVVTLLVPLLRGQSHQRLVTRRQRS